MSSLKESEKPHIEAILGMEENDLPLTVAKLRGYFSRRGVDIYGPRYAKYGDSRVNRLRAYWEIAPDKNVAVVLNDFLDIYESRAQLQSLAVDEVLLDRCRTIVKRLQGQDVKITPREKMPADEFLAKQYELPQLEKLEIESALVPEVEYRLEETQKAIKGKCFLAAMILIGSNLEAILLGSICKRPTEANKAIATPKNDGKPRPFHEWNLNALIDVAFELNIVDLDVKKHSHQVREFRNYIHPYMRMNASFKPDKYTVDIAFQVLRAAMAGISGDRGK